MTMMQDQKQGSSARGASPSNTLARAADETGDEASWVDPVCGMSVKRLSAFFTAERGGTTYRFCSESCRADFEKDPDRFTKGSSTADD